MIDTKSKQKSNRALLYSILYVGLSTIILYSMFPSDPFSIDGLRDNLFYLFLSILALPGQLFSWGIRYGGVDSKSTELILVFVCQTINVIIW